MNEPRVIRKEQRWYMIALGIIVVLAALYLIFGMIGRPQEEIVTPTVPADEAPPVAPSP